MTHIAVVSNLDHDLLHTLESFAEAKCWVFPVKRKGTQHTYF
jgi:hypothetical protein